MSRVKIKAKFVTWWGLHRFFFWGHISKFKYANLLTKMGISYMDIFLNFYKNGHIVNGHIFKNHPKNGHIPKYAHFKIEYTNVWYQTSALRNTNENVTYIIRIFGNGRISELFWNSCRIANGYIFGVFEITGILQMVKFTKN